MRVTTLPGCDMFLKMSGRDKEKEREKQNELKNTLF